MGFLPTAKEGNFFTPVCLFTGEGRHPLWRETLLDRDPPDGDPPERKTPWTETPRMEIPLCRETPWIEIPLDKDPLERTWGQTGSDIIHPGTDI